MNRPSTLFLFFLLYSNDVVTTPFLCDAAPSFLPLARKTDSKVKAEKQQHYIANKTDTFLPHLNSKNNLSKFHQEWIENDTSPGTDDAEKDPLRRLSTNSDHHHETARLRGKQRLEKDVNPQSRSIQPMKKEKNMMKVSAGDSSLSSKHFKPQKDTPTLHQELAVRVNTGSSLHKTSESSSAEYLETKNAENKLRNKMSQKDNSKVSTLGGEMAGRNERSAYTSVRPFYFNPISSQLHSSDKIIAMQTTGRRLSSNKALEQGVNIFSKKKQSAPSSSALDSSIQSPTILSQVPQNKDNNKHQVIGNKLSARNGGSSSRSADMQMPLNAVRFISNYNYDGTDTLYCLKPKNLRVPAYLQIRACDDITDQSNWFFFDSNNHIRLTIDPTLCLRWVKTRLFLDNCPVGYVGLKRAKFKFNNILTAIEAHKGGTTKQWMVGVDPTNKFNLVRLYLRNGGRDNRSCYTWKMDFASESPSLAPSSTPTLQPTSAPSKSPSSSPTSKPSKQPSYHPSFSPSVTPTSEPSMKPSASPTSQPSSFPSSEPSLFPSMVPSGK